MPYINHDVPKKVVTNYGKGRGYKTGGGHFIAGAFHVVSLQKEGGHAEGGGGTNSFEVVLTRELEVSAILMGGGGGTKSLHLLKGEGGGEKFYPVLRGGGPQRFWTHDFPIWSPPPRN